MISDVALKSSVSVRAGLLQPSVLRSANVTIDFGLTQLGNYSEMMVKLRNPSDDFIWTALAFPESDTGDWFFCYRLLRVTCANVEMQASQWETGLISIKLALNLPQIV